MDTQETVQVLSEVADISQRLDVLQMMFFLTVLFVIFALIVFSLFWRATSTNAKADNNHNHELLKTLNQLTATFQNAINVTQNEQRQYWSHNTQEHRKVMEIAKQLLAISNRTLHSLKQVIVILEASNLLDTKEMSRIKNDDLNI